MDRTERFYKIKELLRRHKVASFVTLQTALEVSRFTFNSDLNPPSAVLFFAFAHPT